MGDALEDKVEIDPLLKQIMGLEERGKAHTPEHEELCLIYNEIGPRPGYKYVVDNQESDKKES